MKTLCTIFALILGMPCYSFVLLSSAHNVDLKLFEQPEETTYKWSSKVVLDEVQSTAKNITFHVDGTVKIGTLWTKGRDKLLKIQLEAPKLVLANERTKSQLETYKNAPFLVVWKDGTVQQLLTADKEHTSLVNIKKSIASLMQFQVIDGENLEQDSAGSCTCTYASQGPDKLVKTKSNCTSSDLSLTYTPDAVLSAVVSSTRTTYYQLDTAANLIKSIKSLERHQFSPSARQDLGSTIETEQTLIYQSKKAIKRIEAHNLEEALSQATENQVYQPKDLLTEPLVEDSKDSFVKTVNEVRNNLGSEDVGTVKSAKSFVKLVNLGRFASKQEVSNALESKKNAKILPQLYDVLGFVQTLDSYAAVQKHLLLDEEKSLDLNERYFWSLSISSQPNAEIMTDLLHKYKNHQNIPAKLKETLIMSLAAMSRNLRKLHKNEKIAKDIEETIVNDLDYAQKEDKQAFFRALANLQSERTIPKLLQYITSGTAKDGVLAWKALRKLAPVHWNQSVLQSAVRTFFQISKKHDSSSRTISAEILLQKQPSDALLSDFIWFLQSKDPAYEVKQYLLQTLRMLMEQNADFKLKLERIIRDNKFLNNYHTLAPRGMSTALTRSFMMGSSANGSLVSLQELKSGIVKRGTVNVVLGQQEEQKELFSLGIFAGGLSSFMSSSSDEDIEEESANAGMELTVMGTQLRPFVFFSGQGELMGHVWSGTASERTSAYQALTLLQDHQQTLRLGTGFLVDYNLKGSTSFDLSGLVKLSIFYSNGESMVEKSAGIYLQGTTRLYGGFLDARVDFQASLEPKLNLKTDLDFSSKMQLCMRLTQPDCVFREQVRKTLEIPGGKTKLKFSKNLRTIVPGVTYNLNRKNNEMCGGIFRH